ncbi:MAG: hypothetical protein R3B91_11595 [Planctomycetaceae bacterium]
MQLRLNNPLILAVCLLLPTPVFGQFTELTGRVHKGANTVVGIDATALKATELAQKTDGRRSWKQLTSTEPSFCPRKRRNS